MEASTPTQKEAALAMEASTPIKTEEKPYTVSILRSPRGENEGCATIQVEDLGQVEAPEPAVAMEASTPTKMEASTPTQKEAALAMEASTPTQKEAALAMEASTPIKTEEKPYTVSILRSPRGENEG